MSEIRATLQAFDDAWAHRWESIESVLDGVGEEEAFRQHAAYVEEPREEGWPAPGTIAWHVAHLAHCKRHYADLIDRLGRPEPPPARPWTALPSFQAVREALREAHARQRVAIEALRDEQLDHRVANDMPLREFLAMCVRHDAWHAGQIAVARRLSRGSRSTP